MVEKPAQRVVEKPVQRKVIHIHNIAGKYPKLGRPVMEYLNSLGMTENIFQSTIMGARLILQERRSVREVQMYLRNVNNALVEHGIRWIAKNPRPCDRSIGLTMEFFG